MNISVYSVATVGFSMQERLISMFLFGGVTPHEELHLYSAEEAECPVSSPRLAIMYVMLKT